MELGVALRMNFERAGFMAATGICIYYGGV
jgi:hypothetical protein